MGQFIPAVNRKPPHRHDLPYKYVGPAYDIRMIESRYQYGYWKCDCGTYFYPRFGGLFTNDKWKQIRGTRLYKVRQETDEWFDIK